MSLIVPRNFKRAKEQDAQDAQGDEVIAQKNGYKLVHNTLNDGYWFYTKSGAGWGITATNKVAAVNEFNRLVDSAQDAAPFKVGDLVRMSEGGLTGKITKIEPNGHFRVSFLYNKANGFSQSFSANEIVMVKPAADACGTDAKFKVGNEVRVVNPHLADRGRYGRVVSAGVGGNPLLYDVDLGGGVQLFSESDLVAADSRAADARDSVARDRRDSSGFLTVGTKVRFDRGGTGKIIKVKKIYRYGYVEPEYTVEDEKGNVFIENEGRFTAIDSVAGDAAELRVGQRVRAKDPRWPGYQGRALGNGVYTVKKVDWDGTVKLEGFLDVWISPRSLVEANDACEDSSELKNDADLRAASRSTNSIVAKALDMATRGDVEYANIMRQKVPSWKVGDRIKMKPGRGPSGMTGKIVKVISPPSSSVYLTRYEIDGELGKWLKANTENPTGFDILAANS